MSALSQTRGHRIIFLRGLWRYKDTLEPTAGNERPCGYCSKENTGEGHDGCLGTLPGVMNACCGHGDPGSAYVQFDKDTIITGRRAITWIDELDRGAGRV